MKIETQDTRLTPRLRHSKLSVETISNGSLDLRKACVLGVLLSPSQSYTSLRRVCAAAENGTDAMHLYLTCVWMAYWDLRECHGKQTAESHGIALTSRNEVYDSTQKLWITRLDFSPSYVRGKRLNYASASSIVVIISICYHWLRSKERSPAASKLFFVQPSAQKKITESFLKP